MIIRSRAPLRLGLAGGGTDLSAYSDKYGGAILNATITMYAYATIVPRYDNKIVLNAIDRNERLEFDAQECFEIDGKLDLLKAAYNRVVKDFTKKPLAFELSTYVDAPSGSGLGSSSTLTVAVIGAFTEWLKLPLGEYDIAQLAFDIERKDLNMAGGKQDQYASTFGGFNFMEFAENDKVIVNPLRIKQEYVNELEFNMLLYYTGTSRLSSDIIIAQSKNVKCKEKGHQSVFSMHKLKEQAVMMKEAILKGHFNKIGEILNFGWHHKKKSADEITNELIDQIYDTAIKSGATGGKISGAGGGGFMMFYCPGNTRYATISSLQKFGGEFRRYRFTHHGLTTWKSKI
ncbi:dehydrogenase [bacterium]